MSEEVEPVRALMRRLAVATHRDQLQWQEVEPSVFRYARSNGSVVVGSSDRDGHHPYFVEIQNRRGETIETVTTLRADPFVTDEIVALIGAVRRKARGFDQVVEGLLDGLPPDPGPAGPY